MLPKKCIGFAHDATKHFKNSFESVHAFQNELNFDERGKPEYPEKNLSEQGRELTDWTHIATINGTSYFIFLPSNFISFFPLIT